jgi:hypothetical protein
MRTSFDQLSYAYEKCCSPAEHLAVDERNVQFFFKQCIPNKWFGIKSTNYVFKGYT